MNYNKKLHKGSGYSVGGPNIGGSGYVWPTGASSPPYVAPPWRYGLNRGHAADRAKGPSITTTEEFSAVAFVRSQNVPNTGSFEGFLSVDEATAGGAGNEFWQLRRQYSTGNVQFVVRQDSGTVATAIVTASALTTAGIDLDDGEEHRLIGVCETGTLTLYVDSVSASVSIGARVTVPTTVPAGALVLGDHPNSNQSFQGAVAGAILSRALSGAEISALSSLAVLEGDSDLVAMPRADGSLYAPLYVQPPLVDGAGAGAWTYSGGTDAAPLLTELGGLRTLPLVLMLGQSNMRTTGVSGTDGRTLAGIFLGDPAADAGPSQLLTDWQTASGGDRNGPELGMLHEETGGMRRTMLKVTKGSTKIQEWIDTYWPLAQVRLQGADMSLAGGIVVWGQGEGDATTSALASAYAAKLDTLITAWRTMGASLIVLCAPPDGPGIGAYVGTVRAAMSAAAAAADVVYIDESGLTVQADGIHLDEASTIKRGEDVWSAIVSAGLHQ